MGKELFITSPIPPSVNHYISHRAIIQGKRAISTVYKTTEAKKYQEILRQIVIEAVQQQGWETNLEDPRHFYVDGIFYMSKTHMDANNLWKCLLDAITETKTIWRDDDIVCERVDKILYDTKNPRVELRIRYVDYIGIFDNEEQLQNFVNNNCIGCKRSNRNCSILRESKEGRIREEVIGQICTKSPHYKENKKIDNKEKQDE